MSEIDLNDYKSPEIKVGDQTIQVICRIDVDSLADILVRRTNEQLFHEAATLQGYVKERTCKPICKGTSVSCDVCGSELHDPYRFCGECGAKVAGE